MSEKIDVAALRSWLEKAQASTDERVAVQNRQSMDLEACSWANIREVEAHCRLSVAAVNALPALLNAYEAAITTAPIDMVLYCPQCGAQHVDESSGVWSNPPHRSHLCHGCIWRPADVPTNGVATIATKGGADTWDMAGIGILRESEPAKINEATPAPSLEDAFNAGFTAAAMLPGYLGIGGQLTPDGHHKLEKAWSDFKEKSDA